MSSKKQAIEPGGLAGRPGMGGDGYQVALAAAKAAIQAARTRAVVAVNSELIGLYWDLGRLILDRQAVEGPRAKVIDRLSSNLRREFPEMTRLSPGNLDYMRRLAAAWPGPSSPQLVGKMPWGQNRVLLDKLDDPDLRAWYAGQAVEFGWSRAQRRPRQRRNHRTRPRRVVVMTRCGFDDEATGGSRSGPDHHPIARLDNPSDNLDERLPRRRRTGCPDSPTVTMSHGPETQPGGRSAW